METHNINTEPYMSPNFRLEPYQGKPLNKNEPHFWQCRTVWIFPKNN